jgi:hypothetical protein
VALSLRTRLTAWYSVLLVLTVAVFSAAVLWLHWRLILEEFDEGLGSITSTAANVVEEELGEVHDLGHAATEMAAVVHPADFAVEVLDASGAPLLKVSPPLPLPAELRSPGFTKATETLEADDGRQWRVMVRGRTAKGFRYLVAVGAPLDEAAEQWRTLVRACLIGIPLALVFAAGGGLWLGRAGLRPLTSMAAEAHAITATTPGHAPQRAGGRGARSTRPLVQRRARSPRQRPLDSAPVHGRRVGRVRIVSSGSDGSVFAVNLPA